MDGQRTRCRSSFGNQRSNAADDVRVDLPGLRLAVGHGKPDLGGGEAGELVLDGADVPARPEQPISRLTKAVRLSSTSISGEPVRSASALR